MAKQECFVDVGSLTTRLNNRSSELNPDNHTSLITVLSSTHGRDRRRQRRISKGDLQAAVKYGKKEFAEPNSKGEQMLKYTHADIVYITDLTSRKEITSWVVPGFGIHIDKINITKEMKDDHLKACDLINSDKTKWTSHTVCVIDQSGSMRKADVGEHAASRSDVVWASLAIDFVLNRIKAGLATSTDVITVICMRRHCTIQLKCQPTDEILYNKIIDLLNSSEPLSGGNYIPALDLAEKMLHENPCGSCSLMLLFLSDGKPSDIIRNPYKGCKSPTSGMSVSERYAFYIVPKAAKLAQTFGRRLSISTMGFGPADEDFSILKRMSSAAKDYGSMTNHINSSLDVKALSSGLVQFSSTLTTQKTECTELSTGALRTVQRVTREARNAHLLDKTTGVNESSSWTVYKDRTEIRYRVKWDLEEDIFLPMEEKTFGSVAVAVHKSIFGEGAERMVRRFREVDVNGEFVGNKLVAKESRFVEDTEQGIKFHESFCKTQAEASRVAEAFNQRLDELSSRKNNLGSLPRVRFLSCSVFAIYRKPYDLGLLVEEMLDPTLYKKWNGNNGYVLDRKKVNQSFQPTLDPLFEEEEEEEDDLTEQEYMGRSKIKPDDVPQAFSHFSYFISDRKMLICDLQGVLDETTTPPMFALTDPVIHRRKRFSKNYKTASEYGRTDRGDKGCKEFFRTHKCSALCHLMKKTSRMETPI
eukprot:m.210822 g.210822  ORF g.210822 m.210822 type:complete len:701 (-) comp15827_c0_seq1:1753-3855(-)